MGVDDFFDDEFLDFESDDDFEEFENSSSFISSFNNTFKIIIHSFKFIPKE